MLPLAINVSVPVIAVIAPLVVILADAPVVVIERDTPALEAAKPTAPALDKNALPLPVLPDKVLAAVRMGLIDVPIFPDV